MGISFTDYQDTEELKSKLLSIKGIGNWSAEYIALRGFGDTNAFPKEDLILKRALSASGQFFDFHSLEPWRGYLAIYLWNKYAKLLSKKRIKI